MQNKVFACELVGYANNRNASLKYMAKQISQAGTSNGIVYYGIV